MLITVLAILVLLLSTSIFVRHRRSKGTIQLSEAAVKELVTAMLSGTRTGRIQDIAGKVSYVLKEFLNCDRILFLKYYRGTLELNYYHGIQNPEREKLKIKVSPDLQNRLKSFNRITPIDEMKSILSAEYLNRLDNLALGCFFPVYLRENLYGLYFIRTKLPLSSPALQFLSTALAFSLSTAYHIGVQEQQIKKYEDRVQRLMAAQPKLPAQGPQNSGEVARLLKIKNSSKLIPELITMLRKECNFSRMAFYVEPESSGKEVISINWNLEPDADRILKDNYSALAGKMEVDRVLNLEELKKGDSPLGDKMQKLKDNEVKYLTSISWPGEKKAILAWNGKMNVDDVTRRLKRFQTEAIPLVDNATQFEKVEEMCYTDGLTGLHNFRFFQKRVSEEFLRAKRYRRNLALLIFDIDALKIINDKYGHLAGDDLLRAFGSVLLESVRSIDVISRYGGDEFCLIMPEADRGNTQLFMERIREKIASGQLKLEGIPESPKYSVSIGGAVYPFDADTVEALIKAADMALLRAKSEGRNRSILYSPEYAGKI